MFDDHTLFNIQFSKSIGGEHQGNWRNILAMF